MRISDGGFGDGMDGMGGDGMGMGWGVTSRIGRGVEENDETTWTYGTYGTGVMVFFAGVAGNE